MTSTPPGGEFQLAMDTPGQPPRRLTGGSLLKLARRDGRKRADVDTVSLPCQRAERPIAPM
jgi:hypothetical protein